MVFEWIGLLFLLLVLGFLIRDDMRLFGGGRRRGTGEVIGHRSSYDEGSRSFVARVAYTDHRGQRHEIEDTVGHATERPPVGAVVPVEFPEATPAKGRVPHPVMRSVMYCGVMVALGLLVAKMVGWG